MGRTCFLMRPSLRARVATGREGSGGGRGRQGDPASRQQLGFPGGDSRQVPYLYLQLTSRRASKVQLGRAIQRQHLARRIFGRRNERRTSASLRATNSRAASSKRECAGDSARSRFPTTARRHHPRTAGRAGAYCYARVPKPRRRAARHCTHETRRTALSLSSRHPRRPPTRRAGAGTIYASSNDLRSCAAGARAISSSSDSFTVMTNAGTRW